MCIGYIDYVLPRAMRQQRLKDGYGFECKCEACEVEGGAHHDHDLGQRTVATSGIEEARRCGTGQNSERRETESSGVEPRACGLEGNEEEAGGDRRSKVLPYKPSSEVPRLPLNIPKRR